MAQARKQDGWLARARKAALRALAPSVLTVAPYLAWVPVNRLMIAGDLPDSLWLWLLLPPGWALEWWASHRLDGPRGETSTQRYPLALAGRLAAMSAYFYVLVGRPAMLLTTTDLYVTLVGYWPEAGGVAYRASPVVGALGATVLLGLHGWFTVRQRRWRLTTTLVLPTLFTLGLFQFYYHFPNSHAHLLDLTAEPPAERVFPFAKPVADLPFAEPPFFARDLHVLEDETTIVASSGLTFNGLRDSKLPDLWWVDLARQQARVHIGSVVRQFQSTCSDRLFASPWHDSTMLEIDPRSFHLTEIRLPRWVGSEPVEEINFVLHDCATHRVLLGNARSPVILVWDTVKRALANVVNLAGVQGIRRGDYLGALQRNPVSGRIYALSHPRWNLIELDGDSLKPLRFVKLPGVPADMHVSSDGAFLYVAGFLKQAVWKIDARTLQIVLTIPAPMMCRSIEPTADGKTLLAVSYLDGEVISFDTRTGRELRRLRIGPKAEGLFISRNYAWIWAATGIFRVPLAALLSRPATQPP